MKLVAITEVRYAAVNRFPGDEFEATESDARLLKAIGKAKDAPAKMVTDKSIGAEPPLGQPSRPPAQADAFDQRAQEKPSRRRYLRRDMTAED